MDKRYMKSDLPSVERAKILLSQMTVEQKVFQLACTIYVGEDHKDRPIRLPNGIGQVAIYGGLPSPEENLDFINKLQQEVLEQNPFSIPAIFHIEALSGAVMSGSTTFPTAIGLAASWSEETVEEMGKVVSRQVRSAGIQQTLSPVLDVVHDYRWGRIGETFGEDPTLIAALGCSYVKGFQGEDLSEGIACTGKHFLGYGTSEGALNMTRTVITEKDLHEVYAKPFEAAVRKAGMKSMMNSYAEINGEPVVSSKKIMRTLLREEMGFDGVAVTDYGSINRLTDVFKTAEDSTDAAIQCLEAGIDLECPAPVSYMNLISAVKEGKVDISLIDEGVLRMLSLKFELGLFEKPFMEKEKMLSEFKDPNSLDLAYETAVKTVTMTKNDDLLPLKPDVKKVAVLGPCADSLRSLFSCYSFGALVEILHMKKHFKDMDMAIAGVSDTMAAIRQPDIDDDEINEALQGEYPTAKTLFQALNETNGIEFIHNRGCHIKKDEESIDEAVSIAKDCDVVIMAAGGRNGWGFSCSTGEGIDTTDIGLSGKQKELIEKVYGVNKNIVLVHMDGHPLVDEFCYENIPSIIEGWLPGEEGGKALADVILGKKNPAGRLPITVPRNVGQMPVYHYQYNGSGYKAMDLGGVNPDGYINGTARPQLPFGHGLSYTEFKYSDFKVELEHSEKYPVVEISVTVRNSGFVDGDEVVQLYASDLIAKTTRPNQELAGFKRIHLKKGESRTISFHLNLNQMAFYDDGEWLLEKGNFDIKICKNANDTIFSQKITLPESQVVLRKEREFFAKVVL